MSSIADGPLTSLAFCWRLERADGAGLGLTSCDRPIVHEGVRFRSAPGVSPASVTRTLGLEPNSSEVAGALSSDALSEEDLATGRWNGATVNLFAIDWNDPDGGSIDLLSGELGEVSIEGPGFSANLLGGAARLAGAPCPRTSPECRAAFGDKQCRVDLAGRTMRADVTSASENQLALDRAVDSRFLFGRLRYLSGANCGLSTVILAVTGDEILMRDRPRARVEPGSIVELREGCDKRFETCVSRFSNGINFRGEPHLPGTDLLTRYPGA